MKARPYRLIQHSGIIRQGHQPPPPPPSDVRRSTPSGQSLRRDSAYIVGGGPSLRGFDFNKLIGKDVIAVNMSVFDVPAPRYFITMDYSVVAKAGDSRIAKLPSTNVFVANMAKLVDEGATLRDNNCRITYNLGIFDVVIKSRSEVGIGYSLGDFRHGDNSGYCALQLAVLLGYREIYLLGIDLTGNNGNMHYHDHYKGRWTTRIASSLDRYYNNFEGGLRELSNYGVRVICCSEESRLAQILPVVSL